MEIEQRIFARGNELLNQGANEQAIATYSEAIRLNDNHTQAHCNIGVAYGRCGQLDQAKFHFSKAVSLDNRQL